MLYCRACRPHQAPAPPGYRAEGAHLRDVVVLLLQEARDERQGAAGDVPHARLRRIRLLRGHVEEQLAQRRHGPPPHAVRPVRQRLAQHRAQAEAYLRLGNVPAAIEQLELGLKSGDGDFFQLSSAEARLRELRKMDEEMRREAGKR